MAGYIPRRFTCPWAVSHPSSNLAQFRLSSPPSKFVLCPPSKNNKPFKQLSFYDVHSNVSSSLPVQFACSHLKIRLATCLDKILFTRFLILSWICEPRRKKNTSRWAALIFIRVKTQKLNFKKTWNKRLLSLLSQRYHKKLIRCSLTLADHLIAITDKFLLVPTSCHSATVFGIWVLHW